MVWLFLFLAPVSVQGATIVLKNGTRFQTPKLWVENGQIHFILDGLPAVIAKRDVAELVDAPAEVTLALAEPEPEPPPVEPQAEPQAPASPVPLVEGTAPPLDPVPADPQPEAENRSSLGFQGLTWGLHVTDIPGLEKFDEDPSFGGIVQYRRPNADRTFGEARLEEVIYGFWREQFYTLSMLVTGRDQFDALKSEAFSRFGPGIQSEEAQELYVWYGAATDRMLQFDPLKKLGLLWMRSADLNEEVARATAPPETESQIP